MPEPIDGLYFNWLRAKVLDYDAPGYLYLNLLKILYGTEFVFILDGDDNRREDGLELRLSFLRESRVANEQHWFESPCSILEVLIALAYRAEFVNEMPARDWFWRFIQNLRLDGYTSSISRVDRVLIDRILETWLFRIYDYSGDGGLFPLQRPTEDQRKIELWYQLNRYLDDQGL